jgi:ABC-type Fe3+-hydroxamate transport system substrate-binding protein
MIDNNRSTAITDPVFVFSFQSYGAKYVSFSGNDDSLGPLNVSPIIAKKKTCILIMYTQKAAWLLYVGAFFDLELEAFQAYSEISNNYNCHKQNLGTISSPKLVSWTTFDATQNMYTVHADNYYSQLAQDAGATLRAPNRLQDNNFMANSTVDLHTMAQSIQGSEYIIDNSLPSVNYTTWYQKAVTFFAPNSSYAHVNAIADNKVYSNNGLVNGNNASGKYWIYEARVVCDVNNQNIKIDWSQRSAARPDLALLDLIKLFYPTFSIAGTASFPVWLTPFPTIERRVMNEAIYGNCSNLAQSAYSQTACTIGGNGSSTYKKGDLSTGDKAGISVGAVLFIIIAALLSIWLFRRYRRNQRHNFYRMHDLQ